MRIGLKSIIFLGAAALMLAPALVSGTYFTGDIQERAETNNAARLKVSGELAADQIGRQMHQVWRAVDKMARTADIESTEALRHQFSLVTGLDPRYSWIGAADVEGKVVAASDGLLDGVSVAERPWFRSGMKGPSAEDVHEAKLLEKLLPSIGQSRRFVDLAAPIRKPDGTVTGVLGAHLDWYWIKETLESFKTPGMDIILVSRDRKVLAGPADLQGTVLSVGSAVAAGTSTSVTQRERWPDGETYNTVVIPDLHHKDMPRFGWSIIVRAKTDNVLEMTKAISRSFWITLGTGGLVALALLYLFSDWIVTPLRRALASAERLAVGDVSAPPHEEGRYAEARQLSSVIVRLQSREMRPYQKISKPQRAESAA